MKIFIFLILSLLISTLLPVNLASAENQEQSVYGWQVMTEKERAEYLATLKDMKSEDDKMMFKIEHEELMQDRVRKHGNKQSGK
ncbi:MAG: hypothetical protein OQK73_10565 [Gammaproteobacteria bacterium]|nr:hypothetical protein [Gammaproteobacteria bacterium]